MGNKKKTLNKSLERAILYSAVFHAIVITLLIIFPPSSLLRPETVDITWIELPKGVGEDIYGLKEVKTLPESTIEEQEKVVTKPLKPLPEKDKKVMPEPKEKPKPKKETVEKVAKTTSMDRALAKIDQRLKKREAAQVENPAEGFKEGTSDQPVKDMGYHAALLKYRATVRARILRGWIPPSSVNPNQKETVRVSVIISKSGDVLSARLAQASPNQALNQSAVRAVHRASPFPTPPDPLKWEAYNEGFTIVFNPQNR